MAALFTVYRDDTAPLSLASSSTSRSSAAHNKPSSSSRRLAGDSSSRGGLRLQAKENVDPFKVCSDKAVLGKGKKPAMGGKSLDEAKRRTLASKAVHPTTKAAQRARPSANGVCTGALRTRVIPDALFLDASSSSSSSCPSSAPQSAPSTSSSADAPQLVEIYPSSTLSSPSRSPTSATDSGYARSTSGKASDEDVELEREGQVFADESDAESRRSSMEDREANRRARALTESPLAEITQAFTGLGNFSAANMPPSPSPAVSSFSHSRPPPPTRTRSSPSKSSLSAIPPRMQPYSTTATTKRVKPGQGAASAPRQAPGVKSMRF
ncbi:hypothetical protein JCM8547_009310 [Rhodosporidiobolus lusitaniae]